MLCFLAQERHFPTQHTFFYGFSADEALPRTSPDGIPTKSVHLRGSFCKIDTLCFALKLAAADSSITTGTKKLSCFLDCIFPTSTRNNRPHASIRHQQVVTTTNKSNRKLDSRSGAPSLLSSKAVALPPHATLRVNTSMFSEIT